MEIWHDEASRWAETGHLDPGPCACDDCINERARGAYVNERQNEDGTWSEAEPLDYDGKIDFEIYETNTSEGGWRHYWQAYDGGDLIGEGNARTRLGSWWQRFQFQHFLREAGYQ